MRKSQQGLTLISLIIVGAFLAFALLLAFRCVPAVTEYMAVKRILPEVAQEGTNGASVTELRRSFDRRAYIDQVETVRGTDINFTKQGGQVVAAVSYQRVIPVAGNVSLLLDFSVSTANP